eukprot:1156797-Pelagomonas_calceolata.AAC.2
MWIGWVSGSTLLQGTSVMMSVNIFNGMSGKESTIGKIGLTTVAQPRPSKPRNLSAQATKEAHWPLLSSKWL